MEAQPGALPDPLGLRECFDRIAREERDMIVLEREVKR
jgi:hypothetical protein